MATLEDLIRSVRQEDISDVELARKLAPLLRSLNVGFGALLAAIKGNLSHSENIYCDIITAPFTHGVAQRVSLKRLKQAKSGVVLSCNGAIAVAVPRVVGSGPGECLITLWFNATSASQIPCTLLLLPEGVGQAEQVTYSAGGGSLPITTTGDLIVGNGAGVGDRFPIGPDGYVLTADSTQPFGLHWAAVPGGSGATTYNDTVNFGAFPGSSSCSVAIPDVSVAGTEKVTAWIRPVATADHTANDHAYAAQLIGLSCTVSAGVGITVTATAMDQMQGTFNISAARF